jgi:hypothetical protein
MADKVITKSDGSKTVKGKSGKIVTNLPAEADRSPKNSPTATPLSPVASLATTNRSVQEVFAKFQADLIGKNSAYTELFNEASLRKDYCLNLADFKADITAEEIQAAIDSIEESREAFNGGAYPGSNEYDPVEGAIADAIENLGYDSKTAYNKAGRLTGSWNWRGVMSDVVPLSIYDSIDASQERTLSEDTASVLVELQRMEREDFPKANGYVTSLGDLNDEFNIDLYELGSGLTPELIWETMNELDAIHETFDSGSAWGSRDYEPVEGEVEDAFVKLGYDRKVAKKKCEVLMEKWYNAQDSNRHIL